MNVTKTIMKNLSNKKVKVRNDEIFISESGIKSYEDLKLLASIGIKGVLIGETFMKEENIGQSFRKLLNSA